MLSIKKFCAGLIVVTWGLTEKKNMKIFTNRPLKKIHTYFKVFFLHFKCFPSGKNQNVILN